MCALKWGELSTRDFESLAKAESLVLLPIGSMEQHGPHLPVSTDSLIVDTVMDGVVRELDDLPHIVLPTLWCSKSNEHIAFPGTIFLSPETFVHVVDDISASVARAGFKRLVFMNWHGGNTDLLASMTVDIRQRHGLLTFIIDVVRLLGSYPPAWLDRGSFDIHAGRIETSMLLARYPHLLEGRDWRDLGSDLTRGRLAASFSNCKHLLPEGGPVRIGWLTTDLTEDGVVGDPTKANADEGEQEVERQVMLVCEMLREIAAFEYQT